MEGFSAFVCSAQAFQYALSVVKSLSELRNALKYGGGFLRDEQAGVIHLREIIIQLIPKDKTRLDPGFESHLNSISSAVSRLLRLLQQQRRLQVAVLLVIRRSEVQDSFALLERKKSTLNLYLTAQNTAAIASLTISASSETTPSTIMSPQSHSSAEDSGYGSQPSPSVQSSYYSFQDKEIPSLPESVYPQLSGSELAPLDLDRPQSLQLQHESSASSDCGYHGNTASNNGIQTIYNSIFGKGVRILYEENSSDHDAFQEIGQLSSGRKPKSSYERFATKVLGAFEVKRNKAKNGAQQRIYAPDDPNMTVTYNANVADSGAVQNLGIDVGTDLPAYKIKILGRSWVKRSTT
ncbi:MAG: hypothetical protein M1836_000769 [Candelina mexicana]|nr:MAG: hypothetical protein M1836_000769 [Candelina mexicana]